eukprot:gene607-669_t
MPRHLISDAHEWINEIPTVPNYHLAKPQPRERAWDIQRGKKTLLSLTLSGGEFGWTLMQAVVWCFKKNISSLKLNKKLQCKKQDVLLSQQQMLQQEQRDISQTDRLVLQ